MPLFDMSPNIQETEAASRKRSHDEYAEGAVKMDVDASVTPRKEPVISASVDEADRKSFPREKPPLRPPF